MRPRRAGMRRRWRSARCGAQAPELSEHCPRITSRHPASSLALHQCAARAAAAPATGKYAQSWARWPGDFAGSAAPAMPDGVMGCGCASGHARRPVRGASRCYPCPAPRPTPGHRGHSALCPPPPPLVRALGRIAAWPRLPVTPAGRHGRPLSDLRRPLEPVAAACLRQTRRIPLSPAAGVGRRGPAQRREHWGEDQQGRERWGATREQEGRGNEATVGIFAPSSFLAR